MVTTINFQRVRVFLGQVTFFMGIFAVLLAVSLGISGLVMYFGRRDLFWLGTPVAGPGVMIFLIVEGFILEIFIAMKTTFFGFAVIANNGPPLEIMKKARLSLMRGAKAESEDEDFEKYPHIMPKYGHTRKGWKNFEKKAPQCLWISLLVLAGMNLGMALTCSVLASADPSGVDLAIRQYNTDPGARQAIDWVQQAGECCGSQMYTDWLIVQWCTDRPSLVPSEVSPPGYVNMCGAKHRSVTNDVPESCCTPPRSPCINDPLDLLGLGALHNEGCARYIEERLYPKYSVITKFHLFLCMYKLLLVGLVILLRPDDDRKYEKATDEEAKGLMDDEDAKNPGGSKVDVKSKPSSKSWFSALAKKPDPPKTPGDPDPAKEAQSEHSSLKPKESKKHWYSAVKFAAPLRRMSKVATTREEGKTDPPESPGGPGRAEKAKAAGSQAHGLGPSSAPGPSKRDVSVGATGPAASHPPRPVSEEMKKRSLEMRTSRVSRTRSYDTEPPSPQPNLRGSLSEWSRPVPGVGSDVSGVEAAQITPSKHEERELTAVGVVH